MKTSELRVIEGQELQLVCAGDVMGWLGGLPLSLMEDVRMGRPAAGAQTARGGGAVGAVECVGGTGACGVGGDCGGGSGCCGMGGDCAAN